jgi:hypothetical protein
MSHRAIAILVAVCLALGAAGCASKSNKNYEEVLMPLQTGSTLQRRVYVPRGPESKTTKKKKKEKERQKPRKPESEPSATPAPEEESTPPPDRFR